MTSTKPDLQPVTTLTDLKDGPRRPLSAYLSRAAFQTPQYTAVSAWLDHAPFAFWLVDALQPKRFVELGSHNGYSFFSFCQAVQSGQLSTECFAVDLWGGDEHAGFYGDEVFQNVWNHNEAHYASFARLVRASFDDAVSQFEDGSIDLLHIDGRHFYEDVKHDFETWEPKLSDRAVVLFHDTNVRERNFGVFKYWQEVSEGHPAFEFLHGHGLGVLAYGAHVPEAVLAFLAAASNPDTAHDIRRVYGQLGGVLKTEFAMAQTQADMNVRLKEADGRLREGHANAERLADELTSVQAAHDELVEARSVWERDIAALKKAQNLAVEREHTWADDLADLQAEVSALRYENQRLQTVVEDQAAQAARRLRSTSWRVTAPLRWVSRATRHSVRLGINLVRWAYRAAPLPQSAKQKVKDGVFLTFAPALRKTGSYRSWHLSYTLRKEEEKRRNPPKRSLFEEKEHARAPADDPSLAIPLPFAMPSDTPPKLAVIIHVFFDTLMPELRRYLEHIPVPFDLYVTTDTWAKHALIERSMDGWDNGTLTVEVVENCGRDIAPKLLTFPQAYAENDVVLHLHSKQSNHADVLANWRGYLLETLCGSKDIVESILHVFNTQPDVGMIAAQHFEPARHWINWGGNFPKAKKLASKMGLTLDPDAPLDFPSGSMFWARTDALKPLLDLELSVQDFDPEAGQIDGTLAHAIERMYFYTAEQAGFCWLKVARPEFCPNTDAISAASSEQGLTDWIKENRFALLDPRDVKPRDVQPAQVFDTAPALVSTRQDRALGQDQILPEKFKVAIGIVTYNNPEPELRRCIESAKRALETAGLQNHGEVLIIENGTPSARQLFDETGAINLDSHGNIGFGAGHNRIMEHAFDSGCDLYVAANPDGSFHPDCIENLAKMVLAHDGRALVEAMQFPAEHPKAYDPFTFETPWASGACLAISETFYRTVGGFDEAFFMYCEDVDLSWQARSAGFAVRICPTALFQHAVTNREVSRRTKQMIFRSGLTLAHKWGHPGFQAHMARELEKLQGEPPSVMPVPVAADWQWLANFDHMFSFGPVRW